MIEIEEEKEITIIEKDIQYLYAKIKPTNVSFRGYKEELLKTEIVDTSNLTNMSFVLAEISNAKELDLTNWNTSKVTTMRAMFYGDSNLTELKLNSFDTSNVTDMAAMFQNCRNLANLDVSSFDTSNVTDMSDMFIFCQNLKKIDLSSWDTSKVTTMGRMFLEMNNLEIIEGILDLQNVTNANNCLSYCQKLKKVRLKNLKANLLLDTALSLSEDSVNFILLHVQEVSEPKTITLGSNLSKASEEAIANATLKGFTIV